MKKCLDCPADITRSHRSRTRCDACADAARMARHKKRRATHLKVATYLRKVDPDAYARFVKAVSV